MTNAVLIKAASCSSGQEKTPDELPGAGSVTVLIGDEQMLQFVLQQFNRSGVNRQFEATV